MVEVDKQCKAMVMWPVLHEIQVGIIHALSLSQGSGRDDISNLTVIVVSSSSGYKTAAQVRVQNLYVNSSGEDTHRASIIVVR